MKEIWVDVRVANPREPGRAEMIRAVVDTGSTDAALPGRLLRRLNIRPRGRETYVAWEGRRIRRPWGHAEFQVERKVAIGRVTFEPAGETPILGAVTLEELGLDVETINGKLRPAKRRLGLGPRLRRTRPLRRLTRPLQA